MLPENEKANSPLEALSIARFGGHTYAIENVFTAGPVRITLLRNNPNRVYWSVINEGNGDVRLSFDPSITTTSGWLLPATGGVIIGTWEDEGESVGYEVYAISPMGGVNVRVREVIRI